jgi:molecular chaperone GrpE
MSNEEIDKKDLEENIEETVGAETETESTSEAVAEESVEALQAKVDEHWNELLRTKAEMENLRRRHTRDLENAHKHALDKFIAELLPIADSMELGLKAAEGEQATMDAVKEGLEMTIKMFMGSIGKFGLEQVDPEGQAFDPELHQAMSMQPVEGVEPNQVVTVVQKGYQFNGRLLRPAMVVVSQ